MKANIISIFIALFIFASSNANAQDTLYLAGYSTVAVKMSDTFYYIVYPDSNRKGEVKNVPVYFKPNNKVEAIVDYSRIEDLILHGNITRFDSTGTKVMTGKNFLGKADSIWTYYYDDGSISKLKHYEYGKLQGLNKEFYQNGNVKRTELYKDNVMLEGKCYDSTGNEIPYFPSFMRAHFKPENGNIVDYLVNNIKYPNKDRKHKNEGTIHVAFLVDEEGNIQDVEAKNSIGYYLAEEAVRVIKSMPKWNPTIVEGKPVGTRFIQRVVFKL